MRSITSFQRLEPTNRNEELTDALAAPVADPLWLLGRQWQVGEFEGTDAGSPVAAEAAVTSRPVSAYRLGDPDATTPTGRYGPDAPPLEAIVERERVRPDPDDDLSGPRNRRDAAEAGAHFQRLLAARGLDYAPADFANSSALSSYSEVDGLLLEFPDEDLDAEGERYALAVSGRALDGDALYRVFEAAEGGDSGPLPVPDQSLRTADGYDADYLDAVSAYRSWYVDRYEEPATAGDAWDEDRMEYRFAVTAGDGDERTGLVAEGYDGGGLDWYDFDGPTHPVDEPDGGWGRSTETRSKTARPTPIRVPGMPARRWWELEDGTVNVSQIEAAAEDLSRLLLVEYGLVADSDWFRIPIEQTVGDLTRIDRLTVTDSFGRTTDIEPTGLTGPDAAEPAEPWNMYGFHRSVSGGDDEMATFLAPSVVESLDSDPVEEVEFVRDEAVNVAWAVEEAVEGPMGDRLDRHEQSQQAAADEPDPDVQPVTTAEEAYRLTTGVPAHWLPLVPEQRAVGVLDFRLGEMLATDEDAETDPQGDVLDDPNILIPEEEIPRAGKRVTRRYRHARWIGGSTHLWSGRRVTRGRGSAASGLRFDSLEHRTPSPSPESAPVGVAVVSPTSPGGTFEQLEQEYIVLRNETDESLSLDGWTISDAADHDLVLGDVTLDPGGILRIRTGEAPSGGADDNDVYWGSGAPVWNDMADAIYVHDDEGDLRAVQTYPDLAPTADSPLSVSAVVNPPGDDRQNLNDEYVTIENVDEEPVTMTGWTMRDIAGHEYDFPEGFSLVADGRVDVHSGAGTDSDTDLYWGSTRPIWNNKGDAVLIYDDRQQLVAGALVRGDDRRNLPTFPLPPGVLERLPREFFRDLPLDALPLTDLDELPDFDGEGG
jgi:hypothetical protein